MATDDLLATVDDFKALGLPGDWVADASDEEITKHLRVASDTGKSYLQQRFRRPFLSWGFDVRGAVVDLAKPGVATFVGTKPQGEAMQSLVERADKALAWFRDIANGKATPVDFVDSSSASSSAGRADVFMVSTTKPRGW